MTSAFVIAASSVLATVGAIGFILLTRRFPFSSNVKDLELTNQRLGPFNGYQVWVVSSACFVLAPLLPLALLGSGFKEPSTYDDCILRYVKAGMNDTAVAVLRRSCSEKHSQSLQASKPTVTDRLLNTSELGLVTGRAAVSRTSWSGTLYNGNANITITEVSVVVAPKPLGQFVPDEFASRTHVYRHSVSIPPNAATDVRIQILSEDPSAGYDWSIKEARGKQEP